MFSALVPDRGLTVGTRVPSIDPKWLHSFALRLTSGNEEGGISVGIVSSEHGEGTTTIVVNLAECLARSLDRTVAVVDANLRSPALGSVYGLPPGPGLMDLIEGGASIRDALYTRPGGKICVIPTGKPSGVSHCWGPPVADLIDELAESFDVVLVDSAPVQPYPDSRLLARNLESVVLVLEAERAKWDAAALSVQYLQESGANVLGAVLNRRPARK